MTYTALSPKGPRIALAESADLFYWKGLGLVTFEPYDGIDFVHVDNKEASLFPVAIPNHAGKMQMAILFTGLFFRVPDQKKLYSSQRRGKWTSTMKASGFLTARCL